MAKKINKIISIIGITIALIIIAICYIIKSSLIKDHKITQAIVTDCYWASRGTARYVVEGVFKIDNVSYKTSCQLKCQDLNLNQLKEKLLNSKTTVVYSPTHPLINCLLLEKSTYNLYNIHMPDSLKWMDDLVKCK